MALSMKSHQTIIETVCRSIRSSRFVSSEIFVDGAKPVQLERVLKRWEHLSVRKPDLNDYFFEIDQVLTKVMDFSKTIYIKELEDTLATVRRIASKAEALKENMANEQKILEGILKKVDIDCPVRPPKSDLLSSRSTPCDPKFLKAWELTTEISPLSEPIILKKKNTTALPFKPPPKIAPIRSRPLAISRTGNGSTSKPTKRSTSAETASTSPPKMIQKRRASDATRPCPLSKKPRPNSATSISTSAISTSTVVTSTSAQSYSSTTTLVARSAPKQTKILNPFYDGNGSTTASESSPSSTCRDHLAAMLAPRMTCKKCSRVLRPNFIYQCIGSHLFCMDCKGGRDQTSFGNFCQHCPKKRKIRPMKPEKDTNFQLETAKQFILKCYFCFEEFYNLGEGKNEHLNFNCRGHKVVIGREKLQTEWESI